MIKIESCNWYNVADVDQVISDYMSDKHLENRGLAMLNVYNLFRSLLRGSSIAEYVEGRTTNKRITTVHYEFYKEIVSVLNNEDVRYNFSKYENMLHISNDEYTSDNKSRREPITTTVKRNQTTEFIIMLQRLEVLGLLELIKILYAIR